MSYDFLLFELEPGLSLHAALEKLEIRSVDNEHSSFDPQNTTVQQIISALLQKNPHLVVQTIKQSAIPHIELNDPTNDRGIQISIFAEEISITVPYWHEMSTSKSVFAEIEGYLQTIQALSHYAIYDRQMDQIIDLKNDLGFSLDYYDMIMAQAKK
ncbi:MAG: hypothetical protein KF726_23855 [Anaerolineae bacterium]|nr:hypothetical protein [Anaerolineae bacterium]